MTRVGFLLSLSSVIGADIAPKLGDGTSADWWFVFKLNTFAYPGCSTKRSCIFGGTVQDYKYGYGLQYLETSSSGGKTKTVDLKTDCLGSGDDPVAKTFAQIYSGTAPNYVIWNDQFYSEPLWKMTPPCNSYGNPNSCSAPWGHSKGAMAWDEDGNGFIMQVSTPDWPGSGDSSIERKSEGNTLGCIRDDDVEVSQHFFSTKLTASDTKAVLTALGRASVVTNPSLKQLVKLTKGPSDLKSLAQGLGTLDKSTSPYQATLSNGMKLIAKPNALHVPVWQMVSSLVQKPLRTATWWMQPGILSAKAGKPGCWSSDLEAPDEVQIATTGQWKGKVFNLTGGLGGDFNHAKLGYSLEGNLAIMGDMNQQGSYTPSSDGSCSSSQNGRGGLFFVLEDATLRDGLKELMTGDTAAYYGPSPGPAPRPGPSPRPRPSPRPAPDTCGGAGERSSTCKTRASAGCVYVMSDDVSKCGVSKYGCYASSSLPSGCPDKKKEIAFMI